VYGRSEIAQLVITISNPITTSSEDGSQATAGHGMALDNIRRRLELAHGDRAVLQTHSDESRHYAVLTLPLD